MLKNLLLLLLFIITLHTQAQYNRFVSPIAGTYGQDFIIVNYVDWSFSGISDHNCGTKTYDGHQGTDFVLRGFYQKQAGVDVLAADSGIVTYINNGEFDEETAGDTALGLGNFICIKHPDNYYSYYGHLKSSSMTVTVGEHLLRGQKIAEVGSSGNSTDPHLHFELWYDSLYLVDPFNGPCGNDSTFWISEELYDTSFHVWESGGWAGIPYLNALRHRSTTDTASIFINAAHDTISYWNLQYGLQTGDISRLQWYCLADSASYNSTFTYTYFQDYWYHYFWSYIDLSAIPCKDQTSVFDYYLNDVWKDRVIVNSFIIGIAEVEQTKDFELLNNEILIQQELNAIKIFSADGKIWLQKNLLHANESIAINNLPTGIYMLQCEYPNKVATITKICKL